MGQRAEIPQRAQMREHLHIKTAQLARKLTGGGDAGVIAFDLKAVNAQDRVTG